MKFADCVLDLPSRQLERCGRIVPLEPKVFELLEVLIERRPAVVSNNELDELLWPQVYVARTSLTRLVSKLRVAIGDLPPEFKIIRTAYKTGYAFSADVKPLPSATALAAKVRILWGQRSFHLADGEHLAGRDDACALVIDAGTVSRYHAKITVVSGAASIKDLDSTNGTCVNRTPVCEPTRLSPGDEILLGNESLKVMPQVDSTPTLKVDRTDSVVAKSRKIRLRRHLPDSEGTA